MLSLCLVLLGKLTARLHGLAMLEVNAVTLPLLVLEVPFQILEITLSFDNIVVKMNRGKVYNSLAHHGSLK